MSNNWYETESWYAPLRREEKEAVQSFPQPAQPEPSKKKKGVSGAMIALTSLALIAALIAVLVLPAMAKQAESVQLPSLIQTEPPSATPRVPDPEKDPGKDFGFGKDADEGRKEEEDQEKEDYPEDWDDFFSGFYQETDTSNAEVNIQQGELPGGFRLQLKPAAGKELTLQQLYEKCSPSIVAISGYTRGQSGYNWGTGVVLSEDGLILTNTHVIADCDRATVTLPDDSVCEAKLVGADSISDIAVLKIEAKGLTPAVFGDSSVLEVGDSVAAIGNPLGEEFRLTLTRGIISAIERGISYKGHSMSLLQTDTAINEGNSGGPLLNMYGQVIGITNMKMMSSYSSIEGIGFAIPSATVVRIINVILKEGAVVGRTSIGITVGVIPDEAREKWPDKMPEEGGLYISAVAEGSDALAKGVRPGDIILEVDGKVVHETAELSAMKDALSVGDTMHFKLLREGEIVELDIALVDTNDVYG